MPSGASITDEEREPITYEHRKAFTEIANEIADTTFLLARLKFIAGAPSSVDSIEDIGQLH